MRKIRNESLETKAMELGAAAYKAGMKLMAARDGAVSASLAVSGRTAGRAQMASTMRG